MRGYIGLTDFDWFTFLRGQGVLDEVNFWQPSAHGFNQPPGTPFLFKLKSPRNVIAGYGFFARYEAATSHLAWEAFGLKNGVRSFAEMDDRIRGYARTAGSPDHRVGCIMVSEPRFFDDADWIPQPSDWSPNIVSGKGLDLAAGEGARVWNQCLALTLRDARQPPRAATTRERFGSEQLVRPRLGQGAFRVAVTAAYGGACAITGEHSLPVLEAAHIRAYSEEAGSHEVSNGLLLRADIHKLFDRGYVTVTPDFHFLVSERLSKEFRNGRAYYKRHGKLLTLPTQVSDQPDPEHLRWHNENVFERSVA